jgi:hypothetical protein
MNCDPHAPPKEQALCRMVFKRKGPVFCKFRRWARPPGDEQCDRVGQFAKISSVNLVEGPTSS